MGTAATPRPGLRLLLAAAALGACGGEPAPAPDPPALPRAEASLEAGRPAEARKGLASLDPRLLDTPALRLRAARAAWRARDLLLAARLAERDAAADPRVHAEAALLRAEALVRAGRLEDGAGAVAALEKAGVTGDRWRYVWCLLHLARGQRDPAAREIEGMVRARTREGEVWVLWAQMEGAGRGEVTSALYEGLPLASDPAPVLRALGRAHLAAGRPARALDHLKEAVRRRPWDRDARVDLARSEGAAEGAGDLEEGVAGIRRLLEDDPGDFEARVVLADLVAERARRANLGAGESGGAGMPGFLEAASLYEGILRAGPLDPPLEVGILQGLARCRIYLLPKDAPENALAPGSQFRLAMDALQRALDLDPGGAFPGHRGVLQKAETLYLMGLACKRVHRKDLDHADAVGHYRSAVKLDPRHLEAAWDLAWICYDFLRTPEYVKEAAALLDLWAAERSRRGLPPPTERETAFLLDVRKLAAEGKGNDPGRVVPGVPAEGPGREDGGGR